MNLKKPNILLCSLSIDIPEMSDSEDEVTEKQYKIVLVGDKKVGKTAIALR